MSICYIKILPFHGTHNFAIRLDAVLWSIAGVCAMKRNNYFKDLAHKIMLQEYMQVSCLSPPVHAMLPNVSLTITCERDAN